MRDLTIQDLTECKRIYSQGKNITRFLRKKKKVKNNSKEIIEIAYELQAGSYIKEFKKKKGLYKNYADEISSILNKNLKKNDSIIDVGCGEATTLSGVINNLKYNSHKIFGFDISLSRVEIGKDFANKNVKKGRKINFFVSSISQIPLKDKSIDVVTSSHSIEPNGGYEDVIAKELIRVARKKIILFEPCYEKVNSTIKKRMNKLGYIKNLGEIFKKYGVKFTGLIPIKKSVDKNNPTFCYLFNLPKVKKKALKIEFTDPGTNFKLLKNKNFYKSTKSELSYPIIKNIPIFRVEKGIIFKTF